MKTNKFPIDINPSERGVFVRILEVAKQMRADRNENREKERAAAIIAQEASSARLRAREEEAERKRASIARHAQQDAVPPHNSGGVSIGNAAGSP